MTNEAQQLTTTSSAAGPQRSASSAADVGVLQGQDALLVGCGDLGTAIALDLLARGARVTAIRRDASKIADVARTNGICGVSADIADGLGPDLLAELSLGGPSGGPDVLVVVLTAGARDADAYRRVFLDNLGCFLRDAVSAGWQPRRAVFVSSTAVCAPHGTVTEDTPPADLSETAEVLLAAERQFFDLLPDATDAVIVRPSGLYGPGRHFFIDQVRRGTVRDLTRMTHRIHRDDAAAAIAHLLGRAERPAPLYLLTDDAPARAGEVAQFIAQELIAAGEDADDRYVKFVAPARDELDVSESGAERILSNARLRSAGFNFSYPTFREGYRSVLSEEETRYP